MFFTTYYTVCSFAEWSKLTRFYFYVWYLSDDKKDEPVRSTNITMHYASSLNLNLIPRFMEGYKKSESN